MPITSRIVARRAAGIGAVCIVLAGATVFAHASRSGPTAAAIGSVPIVATPAPAVPPTPVAATGDCASAMGAVRAIQHRFASGSLLDERANRQLTADLLRLDADCSPGSARAFRTRELTPWLTYLPPGAGR